MLVGLMGLIGMFGLHNTPLRNPLLRTVSARILLYEARRTVQHHKRHAKFEQRRERSARTKTHTKSVKTAGRGARHPATTVSTTQLVRNQLVRNQLVAKSVAQAAPVGATPVQQPPKRPQVKTAVPRKQYEYTGECWR